MQPLSVLKIVLLYSIKQIQEPYKSITSKKCNEIFRGRQQNKATITRQQQNNEVARNCAQPKNRYHINGMS